MNTTDKLVNMAFELGRAVTETEEYANLRAQQTRVTQDKEAYNLIMRYQDAQAKLIAGKQNDSGLTIANNDENHMKILEQEINSNLLIKDLMEAQQKFDNVMQAIYFSMNQAITGDDGCSGSCDCCGSDCGSDCDK